MTAGAGEMRDGSWSFAHLRLLRCDRVSMAGLVKDRMCHEFRPCFMHDAQVLSARDFGEAQWSSWLTACPTQEISRFAAPLLQAVSYLYKVLLME